MAAQTHGPVISVMLAVPDASAAVDWYAEALEAVELWNLGSVAGLDIAGSPIFVGQPQDNGWDTPQSLGMPTARIELFCNDPDAVVDRAVAAGAALVHAVEDHEMPWGAHRQGVVADPFGHLWFVGDKSPLTRVG
jgi:PhnB protein